MSTAEFLRDKGVQPSQQRIRIYELLAATKAHPSADSIHRELQREIPTLSRTTVYGTLELFVERGIAQRLALTGSESRFDADTSRHVHFHCRACGAVSDLPGVSAPLPPPAPSGYRVESAQFYAEGLCPSCSGAAAAVRTTDVGAAGGRDAAGEAPSIRG